MSRKPASLFKNAITKSAMTRSLNGSGVSLSYGRLYVPRFTPYTLDMRCNISTSCGCYYSTYRKLLLISPGLIQQLQLRKSF